MERSSREKPLLALCALAFVALIVGAAACGERMAASHEPAEAMRLRLLVYAHFAMAQIAVVAAAVTIYRAHRRLRRYILIVSYNAKGMQLDPPGISMHPGRVYRCHLGAISADQLPPADSPTLVYPMFMLSGRSSGEKMERELKQAYSAKSRAPELYFQPVLGASPWLARSAAAYLAPLLRPGVGVLVVAHGSKLKEPPPEPMLFCRRLRELLPAGTEVRLGYFGQQPVAQEALAAMCADHVLLLPFLLTEGVHTERDLPTQGQAAAYGKTMQRLPVVAELLSSSHS